MLVCVDSTSLWPAIFPHRTVTAEETAETLFSRLFTEHGVALSILTDRGSAFCSTLFKTLCELFQIKKLTTSAFHPQCNSRAEFLNFVVQKSLRAHLQNQTQWPDLIPAFLFSYRGSVTTSTGVSPFFCLRGKEMRFPLDNVLQADARIHPSVDAYVAKLLERLSLTRQVVKQNVQDQVFLAKKQHDKNVRAPEPYHLGQHVWVYDPTTKKGENPKWKTRWLGPKIIIQLACEGLLCKVQDLKTGKVSRSFIHVDRIKSCDLARDRFYTRTKMPTEYTPNEIQNAFGAEWQQIDRLLAEKRRNGRRQFKVRWADGTTTWADEEDVSQFAIDQYYLNKHETRRKSKRRRA